MERIEEALNDCIERMDAGESLESCLETYPEMAEELKPLLALSQAVTETMAEIKPRPEFKAEARYRFHAALAEKAKKQQVKTEPSHRRWSLKWATVALAVLVVFAVGGTTGVASADSVPGQPLYSMKTFVERVQMGLTIGNERKANLHVKFAERRSDEMQAMINQGNLDEANSLGIKLSNHLEEARLRAPALLQADDIVVRLEQLANKQVSFLEVIYDKAPAEAQTPIDTLIGSINDAYETAIEEISDALPGIQVVLNGSTAVSGNTLTGTVTITNNSDVNAEVADVKYTLAHPAGAGNNIWKQTPILRVDTNTLSGLEQGVVINANTSKSFNYSVTFSVPRSGVSKMRGFISIKLAGRNLQYYDNIEFNTPSLQSVAP